jgi:hypothetical protein
MRWTGRRGRSQGWVGEEPRWPPADAAMIEAISGRERGPRGGHFFPPGRAVSAGADWMYHIYLKVNYLYDRYRGMVWKLLR